MFAYIDPNSGSLLIQAVIAGLVALPFFFRKQVARVAGVFRRDHETDAAAVATPPSSDVQ